MERKQGSEVTYQCINCGAQNVKNIVDLDREKESCSFCHITGRHGSLLRAMLLEIFGTVVPVAFLPDMKGIRALGCTDARSYAVRLEQKFDYRNTFYDREPRLDLTCPHPSEFGRYDVIFCTEVLEHVAAPLDRALENLYQLLKKDGLLFLTVPYTIHMPPAEHFGPMTEFTLTKIGSTPILVRPSPTGGYEVFDNLKFHPGGREGSLEMRLVSYEDMMQRLLRAGFESVNVFFENDITFGIRHSVPWGFPAVARKNNFKLQTGCISNWLEQWVVTRHEAHRWQQIAQSHNKAKIPPFAPARAKKRRSQDL